MWCHQCHAEVAALAAHDNERVYCASCGSEIARPAGSALPAAGTVETAAGQVALRDPRELLARWAREDALESLDFSAPAARPSAEQDKPILRFDGSHPVLSSPAPTFIERAAERRPNPAPGAAPAAVGVPELLPSVAHDVVIHQGHAPNPPHFIPAHVSLADKSSKWVTLVGQIFAYFGVGGLTVGTVLVLMGYFGGPANYATTGWLITTAGQMLLFLGVVTLVSGGMEQTTQEVARRIDTLGERLVRIEQAAWNGKSETPPARSENPPAPGR